MSNRTNALLHLRSVYPKLTPAERRVANVVLDEPSEVVHLSIIELAKRSNVSVTTVVNFCKHLGYKGFQEFKILLAQDVVVKADFAEGEIESGDDIETIKEKVFNSSIYALQNTAQVSDGASLSKAVQALIRAREIHFYGLGASSIAAFDGEQKFSRIGRRASAFVDTHIQITRALLLQPGDVAVGLSYSGETREIVEAIRTAGEYGATTIAITNHSTSNLAQVADLVLLTSTYNDPLIKGQLSSRIAQLATIDTLFVAVALVDLQRSQAVLDKTTEILAQRERGGAEK